MVTLAIFCVYLLEAVVGFNYYDLYSNYIMSDSKNQCPQYACATSTTCARADQWPLVTLDTSKCGDDTTCFIDYKMDGYCVKKVTNPAPTPLYPGQSCDPSSTSRVCQFGPQQ